MMIYYLWLNDFQAASNGSLGKKQAPAAPIKLDSRPAKRHGVIAFNHISVYSSIIMSNIWNKCIFCNFYIFQTHLSFCLSAPVAVTGPMRSAPAPGTEVVKYSVTNSEHIVPSHNIKDIIKQYQTPAPEPVPQIQRYVTCVFAPTYHAVILFYYYSS